jgi:hypothetical protein
MSDLHFSIDIKDIEFIILDNKATNHPWFEIEAISKSKNKWKSTRIDESMAKELTNGVYSFPQLKQIVDLIAGKITN